ncbi:bifunctional polynucleotide phosphatase/kinase-like [Styela clava]
MLQLRCCNDRHEPIPLPNGVPVILGRSPQTKIIEKICSRKQVELTANYEKESVTLKHLGTNPSMIGQQEIAKGHEKKLKVGDIFYFVVQQYPHEIIKTQKTTAEKRTIDSYFGPSSSESKTETPIPKKAKMVNEDEVSDDQSDDENKVAEKLKFLQSKSLSIVKTEKSKDGGREKNVFRGWIKSDYPVGWEEKEGLLIYHSPQLYNSSKIAAFDMDGTIITTASGRTFAKDHNDWKILYAEVPGKLKKLQNDQYKIVIITNQLGIGKGKLQPKDFKTKVENILGKLGIKAQVIAITKKGPSRKPNIGTWTWLAKQGNGGIPIDMSHSYYVGDAAGRPKDWAPKKKKDFSCTDRLFAMNLEIDFKTPEEYFLSQKPVKFNMPEFDPKSVIDNKVLIKNMDELISKKQEVVIMVGYPASGKSTVSKDYLEANGYTLVNRDTMKTWQKCVAACTRFLSEGKSVVVDNTNADPESRKRYIDCAKARGCDCRCFAMQVTMEHARHNNKFRELSGSDHDKVPDMVFYQYRKAYKEPSMKEGFSSIVKVNFVPNFKNDELKKQYYMFND